MTVPNRITWTTLTEDQLLTQCEVDTYRASGPGGQKRNKTSSAVRLRHIPSGLIVIAEESRSQHENKAKALKRLWRAFFLELRTPLTLTDTLAEWVPIVGDDGRAHSSPNDIRFWPAAGVALDALHTHKAQVRTAAERLGITTANLIDFLQSDPKLWQEANQIRTIFGQKLLRVS
jgi:RF-1 domain